MLYNINLSLIRISLNILLVTLNVILCTNFWIIHNFKEIVTSLEISADIVPLMKLLVIPTLIFIIIPIIHVILKRINIFKFSKGILFVNLLIHFFLFFFFKIQKYANLNQIYTTKGFLSLVYLIKGYLPIFIYFDIWGNIFITFMFWQIVQNISEILKNSNLEIKNKYFLLYSFGTPLGMLISSILIRSIPIWENKKYFFIFNIISSILCILIIILIKLIVCIAQNKLITISKNEQCLTENNDELNNVEYIDSKNVQNNIFQIITIGFIINFLSALSSIVWIRYIKTLQYNVCILLNSYILLFGGILSFLITLILFIFKKNKRINTLFLSIFTLILFVIPNILFNFFITFFSQLKFNNYLGVGAEISQKISKDQLFDVYKELKIKNLSINQKIKIKIWLDIFGSKISKALCSFFIVILQNICSNLDISLQFKLFLYVQLVFTIIWYLSIFFYRNKKTLNKV